MRRTWRLTPHTIALLAFLFIYLVFIQDVRHWSYRDPSSVFFDPERAFERKYSLEREAEAETWVQAWGRPDTGYVKASVEPSFCVGIATVQRGGARYFRRTVGSVLAGLTERERRDMYLVSFIANVDPSVHSAYNETWTGVLSDQVLTYNDAAENVRSRVQDLEIPGHDPQFDRKPLLDYTHLLRSCYDTEAPYIVILEDDIIAAEGWYLRTKAAVYALEHKANLDKLIYFRLFYNERILGWNSEEAPYHALRAIVVVVLTAVSLSTIVRYQPRAAAVLTPLTITTISFVLLPLCILLYFAAGRLTVAPLPPGLNRMDTYGCCSQAFIFPRTRIPELVKYYEEMGAGKIDVLTEHYANIQGLERWALTPSVFAHVGSVSSKSSSITRWGRSNTENIWNFSFEMFDAETLKDEHL